MKELELKEANVKLRDENRVLTETIQARDAYISLGNFQIIKLMAENAKLKTKISQLTTL